LPLTGDLEIFTVLVGMAAAAASGYLAIKFMINVLKRGSLKIFSYYVFTLGVFVLIDQFLTRVVF
jgi:undecaprenyl-diphosphatase